MIIDFHTHIFPDKIAGPALANMSAKSSSPIHADGTKEGLNASMREAGVDLSVILPVVTRPGQFSSINGFAKEVTMEEYRTGETNLLSFGGIHPDTDNYKEEIDTIVKLGLKGIKLHPDYQGVMIDDIRYLRILDRAAEKGLIISVHAGLDVGLPQVIHCTPKRVREVLRHTAPEKLVLAHMGGYDCWNEVEEYLVGQGVYLDTGYSLGMMEDDQFLRIVNNHGYHRILFATDSPWCDQKHSVEHLKSLHLPKEEEEAIFCKNAVHLLRDGEAFA